MDPKAILKSPTWNFDVHLPKLDTIERITIEADALRVIESIQTISDAYTDLGSEMKRQQLYLHLAGVKLSKLSYSITSCQMLGFSGVCSGEFGYLSILFRPQGALCCLTHNSSYDFVSPRPIRKETILLSDPKAFESLVLNRVSPEILCGSLNMCCEQLAIVKPKVFAHLLLQGGSLRDSRDFEDIPEYRQASFQE